MADLDATSALVALLAEPTRVRLLSLLEAGELTVADLSAATALGQSRVSMHLARLREAGVVVDRKSSGYALSEKMPELARRIWTFVKAEVEDERIDRDRQ